MKEPRNELQKTYDEETSYEEVDVELMNIENVLSAQQDQG